MHNRSEDELTTNKLQHTAKVAGLAPLVNVGANQTDCNVRIWRVPDAVTLDTAAIQQTIDAAAKHGSRVVVPAGVYRLEKVTLRASASWALHLTICDPASIRALTIRNSLYGPNTDRIDLTGCQAIRT